ncbi:MAG: DUF1573 domain-containing protein [Christensenellales bacterium]|jgi:hypothetical protein
MKDWIISDFQANVEHMLIRHKCVLDTLTKLSESTARLNRAVIKSATNCGCIRVEGKKRSLNEDIDFEHLSELADTGVKGTLCDGCREIIEKELGTLMFYSAGLCNALDLSLYDTILKEEGRLQTLGRFSLR